MNMGERNLVPVLTYLFRRIEKRLDRIAEPDHAR
jgi:type IV secretory pathway VirB4 component